jgi:GTP-binding protein Era
MVTVADEALRDADIVLWVVDASEAPGDSDRIIAENLQALSGERAFILGINKADLLQAEEVLPRTEAYRALLPGAEWLLVSALKGDGLEALLQMLIARLPNGPRLYPVDQTTDTYVRDIAAELVREQIFLQMREELPYGTAVGVDEFKERDNGVTYIHATIYVERDSHKKIIIGAKGAQLRKIGAAARREIEELVQGKVFLELWVKVEPNWRRDDNALQRLGYGR